jgi:hypothetical protein
MTVDWRPGIWHLHKNLSDFAAEAVRHAEDSTLLLKGVCPIV